jgi:hypothetical protein
LLHLLADQRRILRLLACGLALETDRKQRHRDKRENGYPEKIRQRSVSSFVDPRMIATSKRISSAAFTIGLTVL